LQEENGLFERVLKTNPKNTLFFHKKTLAKLIL